ncbi:hypothetical protein AY586_01515 [Marichromatium gracile]|uniref:PBP domain-containing protein n=1 Tax=Marichromatium gracile TaxID=1048 RepID=A0ABR5VKP9_MARGR|nr:hypothetical protein AY586_01515 [Marichromatium gracile]
MTPLASRRAPRLRPSAKSLICSLLLIWMASVDAQVLIAHAAVEVDQLTQNEARRYLMMRVPRWPDGHAVRVFVLPDEHVLHRRFVTEVLGLYPYQLRRVWDRLLFSGTGQVPVTVATPHELLRSVASTPGALGYADAPPVGLEVRIIEVR